MHLGLQIEPQFGYSYATLREIARTTESLGFRNLWVSDHLFLDSAAEATDCFEAWTLLAALAAETSTLRLGAMVTCQSYRNPAVLAKMAAGVDQMSGGRLEFGIGAGWKEAEYRAYGFDFPPPAQRVDEMEDTIAICQALWTQPRVTYHGRRYRVDDAVASPKPVQALLPTWVGGKLPRVMRIAARTAHWFNLGGSGSLAALGQSLEALTTACLAVGRSPDTLKRSLFAQCVVSADPAAFDGLVQRHYFARGHRTVAELLVARPGFIVGTPEQVVEHLETLGRMGIEHVNVVFPTGEEQHSLELLAPFIGRLAGTAAAR